MRKKEGSLAQFCLQLLLEPKKMKGERLGSQQQTVGPDMVAVLKTFRKTEKGKKKSHLPKLKKGGKTKEKKEKGLAKY